MQQSAQVKKAVQSKQMSERCQRTAERMAQYLRLDSWLCWTIVLSFLISLSAYQRGPMQRNFAGTIYLPNTSGHTPISSLARMRAPCEGMPGMRVHPLCLPSLAPFLQLCTSRFVVVRSCIREPISSAFFHFCLLAGVRGCISSHLFSLLFFPFLHN